MSVDSSVTSPTPPNAHKGEFQNVQACYKLTGQNYLLWTQVIKKYLKGKGKLGHLTDSPPAKEDSTFLAWEETDSMIVSWLWDAMDPKISVNCMFLETAKEVWDFLQRSYSKKADEATIYELTVRAVNTKQGSQSVQEYATTLQNLWQELDQCKPLVMKCADDITTFKEFVEKGRIYAFLAGLNPDYDQVRIQILGHKSSTLEETIATVKAEEKRRLIMLKTSEDSASASASALVAGQGGYKRSKDNRWCSYCKKSGHNRDRCWKLYGKQPFKDVKQQSPRSQANLVAESSKEYAETTTELSVVDLENFKAFMKTLEKQSNGNPSSNFSHSFSGNHSVSLCCNASVKPQSSNWILDSGATDHMTFSKNHFQNYDSSTKQIITANGSLAPAAGQGTVYLSKNLELKSVLHAPTLSVNLMSISKLTKDLNCYAIFSPSECILQGLHSGRKIGHAKERNGLYFLEMLEENQSQALSTTTTNKTIWLFHQRLGHPPFSLLKHMYPELFQGKNVADFICEVCTKAKHTRVSFPLSNTRSAFPFQLIHSDVWGPAPLENISGAKWYISFIDDCTRTTWVYLLKHKSEVSNIIPTFCSMIHNQFNKKIQKFRTDNAKDYFNNSLTTFFQTHGILHESSCVYTPQQNGVAERKNRHILEVARALLFQANAPKHYWGEAVLTATFLINRLPSRVIHYKSPLAFLKEFHPHFHPSPGLEPKVFGCTAFVHIHNTQRGKLDPRALKCIFLGYSATQKGYKCYHPTTKRTYVTTDVTFDEPKPFFCSPTATGDESSSPTFESPPPLRLPAQDCPPTPDLTNTAIEQPETSTTPSHNTVEQTEKSTPPFPFFPLTYSRRAPVPDQTHDQNSNPQEGPEDAAPNMAEKTAIDPSDLHLPIALRKGTRECTNKPLYPLAKFTSTHNLSPAHKLFLSKIQDIPIPKTVTEAFQHKEWREAMKEEMNALERNHTWDIVDRPAGKNVVDCKWVFTLKYRSDGILERYKARLVAKGFTQAYGIDYMETFAPVAKMNTVRILLSLAAHFDWSLSQFDVKNAFLHGDLEEEIYMKTPPGFAPPSANKVCRLKKALYGLKQSPRAWFGRFTNVMKNAGYKQSQGDHTLFIKHSSSGEVTILLVYVDDIIVTGNNMDEREQLNKRLEAEFEIKSLGKLKYFLGIEVARSSKGIFISQQKYIIDLLLETGKSGCKPARTPIDPNHKLGAALDDPVVDKETYQKLCGKLIYLSHTRPDIAYPVSVISQFMHDPRESHLTAAYRILHYLKGSPGKGILFKRDSELTLEAFTDADYAGSVVDRRSTSGYCVFLAGNPVIWRSKKQNVVARSSAESEFRSLAHGLCELLWCQIILHDLRVQWNGAMKLKCDNQSAIKIARNPVQHEKTKHIEIDRHFIREKLDQGIVDLSYISSEKQIADVLTKGLHNTRFHQLISKLGMNDIHHSA